jgi:hypothetical protein
MRRKQFLELQTLLFSAAPQCALCTLLRKSRDQVHRVGARRRAVQSSPGLCPGTGTFGKDCGRGGGRYTNERWSGRLRGRMDARPRFPRAEPGARLDGAPSRAPGSSFVNRGSAMAGLACGERTLVMTQGVRGGSRERPSCRPRHHFDGKFGVDVSTPPADAALVVLSLRSPGNGKSTWIRSRFEDAFIVNLLAAEVMLRHERDPAGFRAEVLAVPRNRWIVIDEVQRVPRLLDEVHFLMEEKGYKKFALTGSSARKLKRGAANLLAGRAIVRNLPTSCIAGPRARGRWHSRAAAGDLPATPARGRDRRVTAFLIEVLGCPA